MNSKYCSIYVSSETLAIVTWYQREFSHFVEGKPVWTFKKSEVSRELLKETIIKSLNESRVMKEKEYQVHSIDSDLRKLLKVSSYKQLMTYMQFVIELSNESLNFAPWVYQHGKRWRTEDLKKKFRYGINELDSLVDRVFMLLKIQ
jgi:hypothetical protein